MPIRPHRPALGNPDQQQADTDDDAEAAIDRGLQREIARQARSGFVQRHGGALHVARTGQPDKAIAQVIFLQQDEADKHQHQSHRPQRLQQRPKDAAGQVPGRHGLPLHHHRHRRVFGGHVPEATVEGRGPCRR